MTTHSIVRGPDAELPASVGSATLTIVVSRISMNSPVTNTMATTYS